VNARARLVEPAVVVAASLAGIAALVWLGHLGWDRFAPNAQIAEQRYFCEALRDGVVRQPANTWSNIAFVVVAAAIARTGGGDAVLRRVYVALVALLGLGSMCLHASLTAWGGIADVSSMIVYVAYVVALARVRKRGRVLALFAAIGGAAEGLYLAAPSLGIAIFAALVVVFAATVRPRSRWLVAAAASFAAAFAIWLPSQNGCALCAPSSLVQGHAVWHVLCAVASWCVFRALSEPPGTLS
jgi:hypothetical protein